MESEATAERQQDSSELNRPSWKLGELEDRKVAIILCLVLERLTEKYSGAKPIDVEVVDKQGELNARGREWWAQLANCTYDDFKAWNRYIGNQLSTGKYFPNVIELHGQLLEARELGRRDGVVRPEPKQLPPPDSGPSAGWRERMIAAERAKHPEWERQAGESSKDYAERMWGGIAKLDPGMARVLNRNRERRESANG